MLLCATLDPGKDLMKQLEIHLHKMYRDFLDGRDVTMEAALKLIDEIDDKHERSSL